MPVHIPAQVLLRSFVFQYLRRRPVEIRDAHHSEGVQKVEMGTPMLGGVRFFVLPMLGGVHSFNFFNASAARMRVLLVQSLSLIFRCKSGSFMRELSLLEKIRFRGGDGPDPAVKSFSPPWLPPPLRAMPVLAPAQLLLRAFVFPYLRRAL